MSEVPGALAARVSPGALPEHGPARPEEVEPSPRPALAARGRSVEAARLVGRRDPDRFELKYWLPEAAAADLVRFVAPYVVPDDHGAPGTGAQVNTSLYLDSPDYACCRAHRESAPDRFKLRVRAYGDPPKGIAFFETKRKVKSVIVKTRAPVPLNQVTPLLDGSYDTLPVLSRDARRNLESFLFYQTVLHASPCVLVRFTREAYVSVDPLDDIRVTLDRSVRCQAALGPTLEHDPLSWRPIDGTEQHGGAGPHVLLELKFPRVAPLWMRQLVQSVQATRVAFSKYVWAVTTLLEEPWADDQLRDSLPVWR